MTKPIVISLGGSFIAPKEEYGTAPHINILKTYSGWFQAWSKKRLVIVVVGGGYTARSWMQIAKKVDPNISAVDLDWIGIEASRLNARVLQIVCDKSKGARSIITDPRTVIQKKTGMVFGAGWKPGRSTDYDAVMLAVKNGVDTVYNLTNTIGVYDKDPKKYRSAKLLTDVTWQQMQKITGDTWTPGLSMPFDPIASKLAAKHHVTVKIVNGWNLYNIEKAISGDKFDGTIVHP